MIVADQVSVTRGGRRLLDRARLTLPPGTRLGIVGPNGAGKSTLLRLLCGELRPDAGRVTLDGRALAAWPAAALARRRAVLPQQSTVGFPLPVRSVVELGRLPHAGHADAATDAAVIARSLARAGIAHLAGRSYHTLSGGEQQRVQFARVLAQIDAGAPRDPPALLFLDEPTASLDLAHQHAVLSAARALDDPQATMVAVLHDLNLASRYCDRAVVLAEGRIVADGPPAEVLTPALVAEVWGVTVRRLPHPDDASRTVLIEA